MGAYGEGVGRKAEVNVTVIELVVILIVVGVLLYLINQVIPMDGNIKKIINVVVVICVLLWLLEVFGLIRTGMLHGRIGAHGL